MMNTEENEAIFWDCSDPEELIHESKDEAIEYYLDSFLSPQMKTSEAVLAALPETITVTGYCRRKVCSDSLGFNPLYELLYHLDAEYGDPNGGETRETRSMQNAEEKFITAVLSEYEVWQCESCCDEEINVSEWVKQNRSDPIGWLIYE